MQNTFEVVLTAWMGAFAIFGSGNTGGSLWPFLIFGLIGAAMLYGVVYRKVQQRKYGVTVFEMDERPGTLGGIIETGVQADVAPEGGSCELHLHERSMRPSRPITRKK